MIADMNKVLNIGDCNLIKIEDKDKFIDNMIYNVMLQNILI